MSKNNYWERWREHLGMCFEVGCVRPDPLTISDIPSNEELIEIADSFIKEYGIKMDNYGQPETKRDFLIREIKRIQGIQGLSYSPDTVQIIYPLIVNGLNVYDQWGNKTGLDVSINLRVKKVIGLYNLTTQNYESSSYEAETDSAKILEIVKKGGINQMVPPSHINVKKIDLEVSKPSLVYMNFWKHNQGQSDEFLVPALSFPIVETSQDQYFNRKSIVVPLAKELLEQ